MPNLRHAATALLLACVAVVAGADPRRHAFRDHDDTHHAVSHQVVQAVDKAVGPARPNRTLCSIKEKATLHVRGVTQFYAARFPNIAWHHVWVSDLLWPSEREIARWWAVYGSLRCDGLVGPGWSAAAIAVSPLVDTLWLDPAATSTELSDKARHQTFSRTVVSDFFAGPVVADVMASLGWRSCNMFFVDDTFGRSISEAFKQRWRELNNSLETVRSAAENLPEANGAVDESSVVDAIEAFRASSSTVTFAVIRPWKGAGKAFSDRIRRHLNTSMMLFLEPTACDEVQDVENLHYTLCLSYFRNRTVRKPYFDYYAGLNHTALSQELALNKGTVDAAEKQEEIDSVASNDGYYAQFVLDTAYHMMSFMHTGDNAALGTQERVKLLRKHQTDGVTGPIRLNDHGDRTVAALNVINILPHKKRTTVGTVRDGSVQYVNGSDTLFHLKGQVSSTVPSSEVPKPSPPDLSAMSLSIIIAASIIAAVVLVVCLLFLLYFGLREPPKDATHAPKPKSTAEPFTICFTDVEASGMLWARAPEFMGEALDKHNEIIRALIKEHKGYEVKTIGDSFMVAFKDPANAFHFALAVQDGLFQDSTIGTHVEEAYKELDRERKRLLAHPVGAAYDALWHGLRVRVGLHYGGGEAKYSATSRSWDYVGQVVNIAARVEAVGHGGQVLLTSELYDVLTDQPGLMDGVAVTEKGEVTVNGNDTVRLYQTLPRRFERRDFPALRTEQISSEAYGDVAVEEFPPALPGCPDSDSTDGVRSQQSAYAYMNNWDNREALAVYLVRHHHLKVSPKMLLYQHHALVALMSTAKASQRTRTIESITRAWRVPVQFKIPPAHRKLRSAVDAMPREELKLMLVAARVVGSVGINLRETPLLPTDDRDQVIALSTELDLDKPTPESASGDVAPGQFALPLIPAAGGYGAQLVPAVPAHGGVLPVPSPGDPGLQPAQGLPRALPPAFPQALPQALPGVPPAGAAPNTVEMILAGARQRTELLSENVVPAAHAADFPSPAFTPTPLPGQADASPVKPLCQESQDVSTEPATASQEALPLPPGEDSQLGSGNTQPATGDDVGLPTP